MDELLNYIKDNPKWYMDLPYPPYNLMVKEDGDYILFKYSQISSDFSIPLVREARGIILHKPTMQVVCRPFGKFFNYGEPNAADINWNNIEVTEKIDGSLIKIWYHSGWHVSTNSTIDARQALINDLGLTFYDLFVKALGFPKEEFWQMLDEKNTYMFELVSPYSQVVIPYENTELYYLGARNNKSGEYVKYPLPIKAPANYNFTTLKEIVETASNFNWMREGFVVFDGKERIKVKSPAYITAHYARNNGNVSMTTLVNIVRDNEQDEFLVYASEYTDIIHNLENKIANYEKECEQAKKTLEGIDNRKQYVFKTKEAYAPEVCSYLFFCFENNKSVKEFLNTLNTPAFIRLFHLKDKK
jgi:hypothetical protein